MSSDEIFKMFKIESKKLSGFISNASDPNLEISALVETYYQVMNVSSMISMLRQQLNPDLDQILDEIDKTELMILEEFNSDIHPKILENLKRSIQETTSVLQSNFGEKSTKQIEDESHLFDELRKKMSTKEFVEQYDSEISHD
ncbi:hypothetical protein C5F47_02895 [Nitrosopumilus cobalaminigenes]|uniref:Uncharacterized protein n=1 Tax=Nitrosopumilus cobalaminigenes TaxID=1470066 RepID=A0A7D5QYE4_9ARCH|nr:hypothetical protein [Nitrosopumilus cobalaminigenes]QLH03776.1 hypothetical protein C5F47_02895 [Nitrosopumilus cobalaminigenes]